MMTEIRPIFTDRPEVFAIYGFGSFFRGESYRDIDLLVVLECEHQQVLDVFSAIRTEFILLGTRLKVQFDLTVLTKEEFAGKPLRDMDSLKVICQTA
jgi:predicted nucleotidyltransferase